MPRQDCRGFNQPALWWSLRRAEWCIVGSVISPPPEVILSLLGRLRRMAARLLCHRHQRRASSYVAPAHARGPWIGGIRHSMGV